MAEDLDRRTISASDIGFSVLARLAEEEVFPEEVDAFKFAIGVGLNQKKRTQLSTRRTKFNVGTFDRDRSVAELIVALFPEASGDPYRAAEEFAETGLLHMLRKMSNGEFRFSDFLENP